MVAFLLVSTSGGGAQTKPHFSLNSSPYLASAPLNRNKFAQCFAQEQSGMWEV